MARNKKVFKEAKLIKACITLSRSTCYNAANERCSLDVVKGISLPISIKMGANDLVFCPRLSEGMDYCAKKGGFCPVSDSNVITVKACECGHAEVVAGHQKACVASRLGKEVRLKFIDGETVSPTCSYCSSQVTFYKEASESYLVNLRIFDE